MGTLTFLLAGCGADDDDPACASAAGVISIGLLERGEFKALVDGGSVAVVHGTQGGTWIMPALEVRGAAPGGDIVARLALRDGTQVGDVKREGVRFKTAAEGVLLLQFLPVPVYDEPGDPDVGTLQGAAATLSLEYATSCNVVERSFDIQLDVVE